MKLYDVPRNTWVRALEPDDGPPCAVPVEQSQIVKFFHVDGMYSLCRDLNGNFVHLRAWTEVEIVEPPIIGS